jgi:hypothetical protein
MNPPIEQTGFGFRLDWLLENTFMQRRWGRDMTPTIRDNIEQSNGAQE